MFYSLRFGILMAMLAIAAVTITTITILVGLTTYTQFERYAEAGRELREGRVQEAVIMFANEEQLNALENLEYLQALTADFNTTDSDFRFRPIGAVGMFEPVDETVDVSDLPASGIVRLEIAPDGEARFIRGTEAIATLYIDPVTELEFEIAQQNFVESINWTLIITAIMAGMAALTLTVILSRRILHPVAALTYAARRMESGDLGHRVKVHHAGEIAELGHAFNSMAETLAKNEELRQNMVTDIAHELRTPLTNIRGYLEAIQDGVLQADGETIDLLYEEATLLNQLIRDLQELALAEARKLRLDEQALALDEMVEQSLSALQPTAKSKRVTLSSALPDDMPEVCADHSRVMQILRNLLSNAVTHTPSDGCVNVTAEVYPTEVEISVTDTGDGIDADHLPYLFERFYRADPSRSRSTGGAGLGLAIVKQLVEAQGGRVKVVSKKGEGSTFSFTLRRVDAINLKSGSVVTTA